MLSSDVNILASVIILSGISHVNKSHLWEGKELEARNDTLYNPCNFFLPPFCQKTGEQLSNCEQTSRGSGVDRDL